jgi:hypothetical protein
MIYRYPQEVHDFVKEWSPKLRDRDLAKACNEALGTDFDAKKMKAFRGNHGYRNGRKQWTKEEYWRYQTRYPKGFYEYIRDNSWGVSSQKMAEMVNAKFGTSCTPTMIKQFRQRHGIRSGEKGWFQRGHEPGNKGKKLEEYVGADRAAEIKKRLSGTQFKKGERPFNELPLGTIRTNIYGYKLRKKQMTGTLWERWEFLHRAVWEEHNGPIPEGMIVTFKDSDRSNCDISNLLLITKGENSAMTRLGYRFRDPDATQAGLGVIRLKAKAKERRNGKTN